MESILSCGNTTSYQLRLEHRKKKNIQPKIKSQSQHISTISTCMLDDSPVCSTTLPPCGDVPPPILPSLRHDLDKTINAKIPPKSDHFLKHVGVSSMCGITRPIGQSKQHRFSMQVCLSRNIWHVLALHFHACFRKKSDSNSIPGTGMYFLYVPSLVWNWCCFALKARYE